MKLLKFYADWCIPCKSLTKLIQENKDKITCQIEEIDVDKGDVLVKQYGVRSLPTLILLNDDGLVVNRAGNIGNISELVDFINS